MLNLQRGFVSACLMLSALFALPTLADLPAASKAQAAAARPIVFQNTLAADAVKLMHWDQPANFPAGVTQIQLLPASNALVVAATPAGLVQVRQIIKVIDVAPRQVQIKFALAHASDAVLKALGIQLTFVPAASPVVVVVTADALPPQTASGPAAAKLLQTLAQQRDVAETVNITTANNVDAGINLYAGPAVPTTFAATPRINSDSTISLSVHPAFSDGGIERKINFHCTVKSGDTVVYTLPPSAPGRDRLLFFATPTILPNK